MAEFYEEEHTEVLARVVWARRRPSVLWLAAAALSFAVAIAIGRLEPASSTRGSAATAALEHETAEIGRAVDAAAHTARQRADAIANTAMIRAAILTDAATVADVMASEYKLALAPGEVAELFQIRDGKPQPLIRLPVAAGALPAVTDRDATIVHFDGIDLRVVVCARIERLKDGDGYDPHTAGMFVLSVPIALAAVRQRLADRDLDATLAESDIAVHLVRRSPVIASELVALPVPTRTARLTLTVAPSALRNHRAAWIAPARIATVGLGTLSLIAFALLFVLRKPQHD